MRCVQDQQMIEEIIKKSRFIGIISPCTDERTAFLNLQNAHQAHPHASHIVYAYRIQTPDGIIARFHDAGEPSGTAGKPIYQHLEGKDLINVLLLVIRYFGGVKLGAGGLTRAYSNTASAVIEQATLNEYIIKSQWLLTLDYQQLQECEYYLKKHAGTIVQQDFGAQVQLHIELPNTEASEFLSKIKYYSCTPC